MVFLFLSCDTKNTSYEGPENVVKNSIEGSWKLVYADIRENDSLQIKDLSKTDFIKILNSSHFAFFNLSHTIPKPKYSCFGFYVTSRGVQGKSDATHNHFSESMICSNENIFEKLAWCLQHSLVDLDFVF